MTKNIIRLSAFSMLASAFAAGAYAQTALIRPAYQFPVAPAAGGPAYLQVGDSPFYLAPYLGLAAGHDDNIFISQDNPKSSTLYVASPGFTLDARDANKVFQLSYQSQIGRYAQSKADDYVDHSVGAQLDMAFDRRNFLRLGLGYVRGHDPRGTTDRAISTSPDKYRVSSPSVTYAFGTPGAQGRIETYYGESDRQYLNNRETTARSNRTSREFGGTFYWRVLPRTYLLAEARETHIRYDLPGSPFSADERRYYGGVSWEATAATTGVLKVGNVKRRFVSDLPTESATSWEGTVRWAPRTYSRLDFYTVRTTSESTGLGSFILSSVTGVLWTHSWSSVLSTGVDIRYLKDEYQNFNRTDETKSAGLKVGYRFRRWLTLGAEYTYTQRESNVGGFDYDRNLYLLTATASM